MINNNIKSYIDLSNNSFFNNPLHSPKDKKDNNEEFINRYKSNLNNKFNMRIKKLLDKVQQENDKIKLLLEDKKDKKDENGKNDLDSYINNVNKKYDFLFQNNRTKTLPGLLNPFENPVYNIPKTFPIKIKNVNIDVEINNINDLLELIKKYPIAFDVKYNINMKAIHDIKKPLERLNKMIGMQKLKGSIVDQIIYFIQNLHQNSDNNGDFMHTVIYGPPGTGKTEIANIIGNIFSNLGILKNKIFKKVTRSELIAGYLGQTAIKTKDVVKSCLGGCLFIDEAYALGNNEKRDSFAKECIDTLCKALSFYKNDLMVIIAGYEKELKDCFFAYNSGLESRFTWRFNTDNYNATELNQIFHKKILDIGWSIENDISDSWFENKMEYFKYFGRDMETLLAKTKICHSKRVFCKTQDSKKKITLDDIDNGFKKFIDNDEVKKRKDKNILAHMYL